MLLEQRRPTHPAKDD